MPTARTAPATVVPLDTLGAGDRALVGGKAANLGELMRIGRPVPAGFVITTEVYAEVAARAGLPELLRSTGGVPEPGLLRAALLEADMPSTARGAIAEAYADLGDEAAVAVRSSATAEDLPGATFAGQQDSFLNILGLEAVIDAVQRCWASLWTDRAVADRRERAIEPAEVRIAVVVQRMVDAEVAGVLFTADPVSGSRERTVVDAGRGLGEAVVSGRVTPDHYVLDAHGELLESHRGRGEVVVRPVPGGGVRHEARSGEEPAPDRLLEAATLTALAAHGRLIAEHFGRPQDVEWALARGTLWITQARPMTAVPPAPLSLSREQRLQASILTEHIPLRPYPMDMTTTVARGPARMMNQVAGHYGVAGVFEDVVREEDGIAVRLQPSSPHLTPRVIPKLGTLLHRLLFFPCADWWQDPRREALLAEIDRLEAVDLHGLSWPELLRMPDRALSAQDYCRDLRIDYLPHCGLSFGRLALLARLLGRQDLITALFGGARTRTEDSDRALTELAEQARRDPALHDLITGEDAAPVLAEVAAEERFAGFRSALRDFLHEYGRRETTSPMLVSQPTLAESPEIVIGMVRSQLLAPHAPPPALSRSQAALEELLSHPRLRTSRRKRWARRWVRTAQDGTAFREDTHFYVTAALPTLRRALLEIGSRLMRSGALEDADDVFHLRWEEVEQLDDPPSLPAAELSRLRTLVRRRAARRSELSGVPMIDLSRVFPASGDDEAVVTGTAAGAGRATGTARVIRSAQDFDRLGEGEVLVCPFTNPAWTPLFQRAAAVVVDTGAIGSHAAIVAREHGIPAVMGTATGTTRISDGEIVTVDGTRGRVTRGTGCIGH